MSFTLTDLQKLDLRKRQKEAKKTKEVIEYIKISVLLFLNNNTDKTAICDGLGIHVNTVEEYKKKYEESKNLSEYLATHYKYVGRPGSLEMWELLLLMEEIDENYYPTCKSISGFIKKRFNKDFTPNGLRFLLKKLGYTYKQVTVVPGKADAEAQEGFVEEINEIKDELVKNNEKMFFLDGVHPTHNQRSVRFWCRKGEEKTIKSNTGRQRVNINGAMNAIDPCDVIAVEGKSVNAELTISLLSIILARNQSVKKIHLVADNARYYKNEAVKKFLEENPKLEFHFLPSYSPNLNLIERLWRLLRKEKLDLKYYEKFDDFKKNVFDFFENIESYRDKLESLMTFKFHIRKEI